MDHIFIVSSLLISGLAGGTVFFKKSLSDKLRNILLALGAGSMVSIALVHILPEALEMNEYTSFAFLAGFLGLYVIEELLTPWHTHENCHGNHHDESPKEHTKHITWVGFGAISLHTIFDGVLIAWVSGLESAVVISVLIGVILHQIPLSFALASLLKTGNHPKIQQYSLLWVFALSAVFGYLSTLIGIDVFSLTNSTLILLSAAAGGSLLYVATSDILPLIHRSSIKRSSTVTVFIISSIIVALTHFFE